MAARKAARKKTAVRHKGPVRARKTPKKTTAKPSIAASQFKTLQRTIEDLRKRLQKESAARVVQQAMVREATKVRNALASETKALAARGARLHQQLQKALGDMDSREAARKQALSMVQQLRKELSQRTSELRRKTEELSRLAAESARKAKDIVMGEAPSQAHEGHSEGAEVHTHLHEHEGHEHAHGHEHHDSLEEHHHRHDLDGHDEDDEGNGGGDDEDGY